MHLNPVLAKPCFRLPFLGITNVSGLSVGYLANKQKSTKQLGISKGKSISGTVDYNQKG
jgi:hypothetical protein